MQDTFFPENPPSGSSHSEIETSVCAALSSPSLGSNPPVTLYELSAAVFSLKTGTSPGLDRITPELIQSSYNVTKCHLLALMNACFHLEIFPDQWKLAKVTVIGKPNKLDYSSLNSFRPISVANCMAKILEKIILGRLMWFARSSNWLSDSQHGFLEGRSTETAAHSLVSHIESAFSSKEHAACAFFDIISAFDSAWHPAILLALVKRSCPPYLTKLVRSFLSNRKARLSLANESVETKVNMGCPQGGVLSPFLWTILADDLLRCSFPFHFVIIGYADDITVCVSHKDQAIACQNLQIVCDFIAKWCGKNKLSLNALKTILMIMSRKRCETPDLCILINGVKIVPSSEAKFLGFLLDNRLSWLPHESAKCIAAKRALHGAASCLRATWGCDKVKLTSVYKVVVEPILLYGCAVRAAFAKTKRGVKLLRSWQRTAILLMTHAFKTAPTDALLLLSNLIPIELHIAEITALRFLSWRAYPFSSLSLNSVSNTIPHLQDLPKLDVTSRRYYAGNSPWKEQPTMNRLDSTDRIDLCPIRPGVIRIYIGSWKTESCGFRILITDHSGMIQNQTMALPATTTHRQVISFATASALHYVSNHLTPNEVELYYSNSLITFYFTSKSWECTASVLHIKTSDLVAITIRNFDPGTARQTPDYTP